MFIKNRLDHLFYLPQIQSFMKFFRIATLVLLAVLLGVECKKDHTDDESIYVTQVFANAIPTDISFANKNVGFISGSVEINTGTAVIAKTIDGGESWKVLPVYIENSPSALIRNIYAKSADSIYATYSSRDSRCGVCFSKDGGLSWRNLGNLVCGAAYNSVFFRTSQIGFICRAGDILQTIDGGSTWNTVFDYDGLSGIGVLFFTDSKIGYAYGGYISDYGGSGGTLLKTIDGGNSWKELHSLRECITSLNFIDNEVGYAFTYKNNIYKTVNGGGTWSLLNNLDGVGSGFYASVGKGKTKYLAFGTYIFKTTDDFKTVTKIYKSLVSGSELSIKAIVPSEKSIFILSSTQSVIRIVRFG